MTGSVVARREWSSSRTRSIWWNQLVLGASVVVISVVILGFATEYFASIGLIAGVAGILVITAATLAIPWAHLPAGAVFAVPFLDLVAIGIMAASTDARLGFLWAFPVIWIGSFATLPVLAVALVLIAGMLSAVAIRVPFSVLVVPLTILVVTNAFIGITAFAGSRRNRAFRRLLRLQAARHRRTSLRIAADERRVVELTNALDDGIARVGLDGRLLFVNDAYARLYGIDAADLTQPPRSVEYEDTGAAPVPEHDRPLRRAGRGEVFVDERVWLFDSDGRWRALAVSAKRMSSAEDPATTMFVIARDVTDVLEAERDRERIAAFATHEMRHPLTAILGNAELVLDDADLDATSRERLEVVRRSSERLDALVSDLVARTDRAEGVHAPIAFDLRGVVTASAQSFAAAAASGDVAVELQLDEQLPIVADAFRLRQVVDNLLSNAIKYTGPGGRVFVAGRSHDGRVAVTITDTGIGMSPADVARVFDPYFRAEAAESFAPGTGLGMGIARELLERQGGTLAVDSRLAAGTTVSVDLPAAVTRRAAASDGSSLRVATAPRS